MKYLFLVLFLFLIHSLLCAENYYVRSDADGKGNGKDWSNAYLELPKRLKRGNTYYIADGTYNGHVFKDPEKGSTLIIIKKATQSDHGTDIGWKSSYGDGVAHFASRIRFDSDYYVFDGQVGSKTTGHGFKITTYEVSTDSKLCHINKANYISVSHVEMEHVGVDTEFRQDCIYVIGNKDEDRSHHISFTHCYVHDVNRTHGVFYWVTDIIIEHCHFYHRHNESGIHGTSLSFNHCSENANNIIRYNTFWDVRGTNFIGIKDSIQGYFYVYGNVFYQSEREYTTSNGIVTNTGGDTNHHMFIYNNTIVDCTGYATGISFFNGSKNLVYNNIWYNCENVRFTGVEHDYNAFFNSGNHIEQDKQILLNNPFVSYENHDYRLILPTFSGYKLESPFNRDMDGIERGNDSNWDRGAFEYIKK